MKHKNVRDTLFKYMLNFLPSPDNTINIIHTYTYTSVTGLNPLSFSGMLSIVRWFHINPINSSRGTSFCTARSPRSRSMKLQGSVVKALIASFLFNPFKDSYFTQPGPPETDYFKKLMNLKRQSSK